MKSRGNIRVKQLINRGSLLAPATAIFVYVLETSSAVAQQSLPYYGPHPWWGGGWMFFGPLMMIICVTMMFFMMRGGMMHRSRDREAVNILKERYARGEINQTEYEEQRRILGA